MFSSDKPFILNLSPAYCEALYQEYGTDEGRRHIGELESSIESIFVKFEGTYGFLPSVGDRIEIDDNLSVVVDHRKYMTEVNGSKMLFYQISKSSD